MQKKILGTILLTAALSLLVYNLFIRKDAGTINISNSNGTNITQKQQMQTEETEQEEPVYYEIKKSDTAVRMGDSISTFNHASSIVYEFIENINTGSISKAYEMLNKEYLNEFGLPYEAFKQKYSFTNEKAFKGESLLSSEFGVIISGYLIDNCGGESEDLENSYMPFNFTIYDDNTIADIGIISIYTIEKMVDIVTDVGMKISKVAKTTDGIIIYATIENNSTDVFKVNTGNYGFYATYDKHTYAHMLMNSIFTDYELQPEEVKHYKILFPSATEVKEIGITLYEGNKINLGGITK